MRYGYQPPNRYPTRRGGAGALQFHAVGCRTDGGPGLPRGVCRKCAEDVEHQFASALLAADRRRERHG